MLKEEADIGGLRSEIWQAHILPHLAPVFLRALRLTCRTLRREVCNRALHIQLDRATTAGSSSAAARLHSFARYFPNFSSCTVTISLGKADLEGFVEHGLTILEPDGTCARTLESSRYPRVLTELLQALAQHGVTSLALKPRRRGPCGTALRLSVLPNLAQLASSLREVSISGVHGLNLSELGELTGLERLHVNGATGRIDVCCLAPLTRLTHLELLSCQFEPRGVSKLTQLRHLRTTFTSSSTCWMIEIQPLTQLTALELQASTDCGMQSLAALRLMPGLVSLVLHTYAPSLLALTRMLSWLSSLTSLTSLRVCNSADWRTTHWPSDAEEDNTSSRQAGLHERPATATADAAARQGLATAALCELLQALPRLRHVSVTAACRLSSACDRLLNMPDELMTAADAISRGPETEYLAMEWSASSDLPSVTSTPIAAVTASAIGHHQGVVRMTLPLMCPSCSALPAAPMHSGPTVALAPTRAQALGSDWPLAPVLAGTYPQDLGPAVAPLLAQPQVSGTVLAPALARTQCPDSGSAKAPSLPTTLLQESGSATHALVLAALWPFSPDQLTGLYLTPLPAAGAAAAAQSAQAPDSLAGLSAFRRLDSLSLQELPPAVLGTLGKLDGLSSLRFVRSERSSRIPLPLARLALPTSLAVLALHGLDGASLAPLAALSRLERLELRGSRSLLLDPRWLPTQLSELWLELVRLESAPRPRRVGSISNSGGTVRSGSFCRSDGGGCGSSDGGVFSSIDGRCFRRRCAGWLKGSDGGSFHVGTNSGLHGSGGEAGGWGSRSSVKCYSEHGSSGDGFRETQPVIGGGDGGMASGGRRSLDAPIAVAKLPCLTSLTLRDCLVARVSLSLPGAAQVSLYDTELADDVALTAPGCDVFHLVTGVCLGARCKPHARPPRAGRHVVLQLGAESSEFHFSEPVHIALLRQPWALRTLALHLYPEQHVPQGVLAGCHGLSSLHVMLRQQQDWERFREMQAEEVAGPRPLWLRAQQRLRIDPLLLCLLLPETPGTRGTLSSCHTPPPPTDYLQHLTQLVVLRQVTLPPILCVGDAGLWALGLLPSLRELELGLEVSPSRAGVAAMSALTALTALTIRPSQAAGTTRCNPLVNELPRRLQSLLWLDMGH